MTASPQKIFDRTALHLAQQRAARRQEQKGVSFLYQRAAADAASRLEDINRQFNKACLVGLMDGREAISSELQSDRIPTEFHHATSPNKLDGSYDLIISLLELQSDETLPNTLLQFRQHLSPDGLLIIALLGGDTLTELRQSLYATDQQVFGGATARVFPMVDYSQAAMLLGRTGLALPVVDTDRLTVNYGLLTRLIADLRDLGLTNTLAARDRRRLPRHWLDALQATYAKHFSRPDGKLKASFEILWMTGWTPHESQQKPLKPGSAKMRLADALKTKEKKL